MSDVIAIRYLLSTNVALTAVVAPDNIMAGQIPQGTVLPAVAVNHISGVWISELSQQGKQCRARVQVTVMANDYVQQKQLINLVRDAVPRQGGMINNIKVDSILRDGSGADFRDDDLGHYMETQDFIVIYNE